MFTPEADGFGKSVLETRRQLLLITPDSLRPDNTAAICLEPTEIIQYSYQPGGYREQRGTRYYVEGSRLPYRVPLQVVHVVDELGETIAFQSLQGEINPTRQRNPYVLRLVEEQLVGMIVGSFALLEDYGEEAGVKADLERTYQYNPPKSAIPDLR